LRDARWLANSTLPWIWAIFTAVKPMAKSAIAAA